VSGMLGGLGGAIAGNVLYDKFGRPHPEQGGPVHAPTPEGVTPSAPVGGDVQSPHEVYDPGAAVTGDWGGAETSPNSTPDQGGNVDSGSSGDWGGNENADSAHLADAGSTGDWGTGASEEQAADAGTGDWGDSAQGGGEADWGSEEPSGGSDDQGGSW
jgi:hypothetical protein